MLGEDSKLIEEEACAITACPHWHVSTWSNCSGRCGLARRERHLWCSHNEFRVDEDYCLDIYHHKPPTTELCNGEEYCPDWLTGPWSEVSACRSSCVADLVR